MCIATRNGTSRRLVCAESQHTIKTLRDRLLAAAQECFASPRQRKARRETVPTHTQSTHLAVTGKSNRTSFLSRAVAGNSGYHHHPWWLRFFACMVEFPRSRDGISRAPRHAASSFLFYFLTLQTRELIGITIVYFLAERTSQKS